MIFDELVLENFGVYEGRQTVALTPVQGKPIVLFGGLNGGGKTTLLDAIQLLLYGSRARISNRGGRPYRTYLIESIHRGANPLAGTMLKLSFHRWIDGKPQNFAVQRSWRLRGRDVVETFVAHLDGREDPGLTERWDEFIEGYLPSEIAHLFFFDGEQIRELADKDKAANILRTAVSSLFGIDLVDRLNADLKVLERQTKSKLFNGESLAQFKALEQELLSLDKEQESLAVKAGGLRVECDKLTNQVLAHERGFQQEGGELFMRRTGLEERFKGLKRDVERIQAELRELASSTLPLVLIRPLLAQVRVQAKSDLEVREAKALRDALASRDAELLKRLSSLPPWSADIEALGEILAEDRNARAKLADTQEVLAGDKELPTRIDDLLTSTLPALEYRAKTLLRDLETTRAEIECVEGELARVPSDKQIAGIQALMEESRRMRADKQAELDATWKRISDLRAQRAELDRKLEKAGRSKHDEQIENDDRDRILYHSAKARSTLERLKINMTAKRCAVLENLVLSSFRNLLRKHNLVTRLTIDPASFSIDLYDNEGLKLPFERLSAGERQLLATAILWGLARASGRVLPMLIDTPLGRLDTDHRKNLVEQYFPCAAPQLILLSTDQELVGSHYDGLHAYISHEYRLVQTGSTGTATKIERGYLT